MEANENKKLSTSHSYSIEKSRDDPPCKHFSIRGYVAKMGQKDRKMCSPFLINESDAQPSLPPLVVARFKSWSCNICREQNGFNVIDKSDQRNSGNGIQESSMSDRIPRRRDIDLNIPVDLLNVDGDNENNDNDNVLRQINNEKKNDDEVAIDRITDHDPGLESNLNHQVSNAQSLEVCLIPVQETHTNEKCFEGNVASNMGIVNGNLKTKYKSSSEVLNEENYIFKYNQCIEEFRKSCTGTKEVLVVNEKDNVLRHTLEQFPLKPLAEDSVPAREMNNNVENDVQEHHQKKYIHKSSKKRQKMRLLKDILRENDEPNTEKFRKERSPPQNSFDKPGDSQIQTIILDKVVGEGGNKKLIKNNHRGRNRKLPLDENYEPSNVSFQRIENEIQNIELYTVETRDTVEGKRKMLHENQERENYFLVENSFAQGKGKDFSRMPAYIGVPLSHVAPNEKRVEEGQHLSINNSSQEENQLTFPWPIQEGTSNYQLTRKEGEINSFGERRFPSTNALSRKGKRVLIDEIDESTEEDTSAKDNELHCMKSYIDLTAEDEESDQDTLMEIAEIMANSLPDVDNLNRNQKN